MLLIKGCHLLCDELLCLQNMWDLTPDTDLLKELPEEYTFETALADLIVSCLIWLTKWSGCAFDCYWSLGADTLLLIYQDNSLQAVWSNSKNDRRLIRYDTTVVTIWLVLCITWACITICIFYEILWQEVHAWVWMAQLSIRQIQPTNLILLMSYGLWCFFPRTC